MRLVGRRVLRRRTMRLTACVLGMAAVLVTPAPAVPQDSDRKAQEEKRAKVQWAKDLLDDFFKAIDGRQPGANALALLGEDLRKEFSVDRPEFRMWQGNVKFTTGWGEVLDGQDEVVFKGLMKWGPDKSSVDYDFV